MADYLYEIATARGRERIALLIRAQGCRVAAALVTCYDAGQRCEIIAQHEQHAQTIERCETLTEARALLRQWGYITPRWPSGRRIHDTESSELARERFEQLRGAEPFDEDDDGAVGWSPDMGVPNG